MRPFFFGDSGCRLFGVHHPAGDAFTRSICVVLAYPWLAEYNGSHLAFRKLAGMLERSGFSTLRFDYSGTGDSDGLPAATFCEDWAHDIVSAADELRALSGVRSVCVVGLGLGATLAVKAASIAPLEQLVLWEPVASGASYLRALDELDKRHRLARLYPAAAGERSELLGFPFSASARLALSRLDLAQLAPLSSSSVSIVAPTGFAALSALNERFRHAHLELLPKGTGLEDTSPTTVLAMEPLRAIVRILERADAA